MVVSLDEVTYTHVTISPPILRENKSKSSEPFLWQNNDTSTFLYLQLIRETPIVEKDSTGFYTVQRAADPWARNLP